MNTTNKYNAESILILTMSYCFNFPVVSTFMTKFYTEVYYSTGNAVCMSTHFPTGIAFGKQFQ